MTFTNAYADPDGYLDWLKPQVPPRPGQTTVAPAAVAPPPAPAGTIGLDPGFTPNYLQLIKTHPTYLSYKNSSTLDVSQAAARRKAALQALAVQYGGLGGGFKDAYGDLDSATLELAKANPFSGTARLSRNYEQGVEAFKRALAARRGLQSGELTHGLQQADYARAASEYDLGQEFARAAQTAINDYLGAESSARTGEATAIRQAEQGVYENPLNRPREGTEAKLVSDWQARYGQPVYQGPDGKLYIIGADGNPVEFMAPTAGTTPAVSTQPSSDWIDLLARTLKAGPSVAA